MPICATTVYPECTSASTLPSALPHVYAMPIVHVQCQYMCNLLNFAQCAFCTLGKQFLLSPCSQGVVQMHICAMAVCALHGASAMHRVQKCTFPFSDPLMCDALVNCDIVQSVFIATVQHTYSISQIAPESSLLKVCNTRLACWANLVKLLVPSI